MQSKSAVVFEVVVLLGSVVATAGRAPAQDVAPPPGFIPGQDADTSATAPAAPRFFPGPDAYRRTESGSGPGAGPSGYIQDPGDPYQPQEIFPSYPPVAGPVLFGPDVTALPRIWFRAEALFWWTKSSPVPVPIVTQGNPADAIPGALGQPGTSVLIGDENINFDGRGGGRFGLGFAFDDAHTWGLEGSYFFLANVSVTQGVSSDGGPGSALLAFPFFDPTLPGENSSFIANPGSFAGNAVLTVSDFLQGLDVNLVHNVYNVSGLRFDLLGGFRWVNLQENLSFITDSPSVAPNPPDFFHTFDRFNANNNFYGGQLGLRASYSNTRLYFSATGKLALGGTVEHLFVNGGTITNAGGFATAPGAYLTQPTNMGTASLGQFAVVPEVNLNFGVRLNPWASIEVGYSFLYLSAVARPGDQIDRVINPTQAAAITGMFPGSLSGPARPALNIHSSDFWAQGLNFGFVLRY
jgi:hypothetical protein